MSYPRFIHLRVHTEYSLLEGAVPVKKLIALCEKAGMPAVAVTDTNNLFGALEFANKASKEGVQPIIGCQLDVSAVAGQFSLDNEVEDSLQVRLRGQGQPYPISHLTVTR